MNSLLKLLFHYLMFGSTMFFAAGAVATGGTDGAVDAGGHDSDAGAGDVGLSDGGEDGQRSADEGGDDSLGETDDQPAQAATPKEEPEVSEFKGFASSRVRALTQQSPKLAEALKENPQIQQEIEARFRRDAAYREMFPTVAEARQMRERFPNGLADVQALEADVKEVEQLDQLFYTKDTEGNYAGHAQVLDNMFRDDREATLSFLRTVPKEWARLDRDSYNEVNGQIVGATLAGRGVFEFLNDQIETARAAKQDGIAGGLTKLLNVLEGYTKAKPLPSDAEQSLARDRQKFQRETAQRTQEEGNRFHQSFVSESKKLQLDIIGKHPAMARLAKVSTISETKRGEIAGKVRAEMEKFLSNSASFMRKLKPAHASRNLQETIDLQKAAWSQTWLLNAMVRKVLRVETPALVNQNRDSVRRRTPPTRTPAKPGAQNTPKGPRKIGGEWFKGDGSKFTTAEVLAGKHLQA
jgi:hypothetical protein